MHLSHNVNPQHKYFKASTPVQNSAVIAKDTAYLEIPTHRVAPTVLLVEHYFIVLSLRWRCAVKSR